MERALRFGRNALTGGLATLTYFALYLPLYKGLGLDQSLSDDIGLSAGAVVQFVGCRYYVFRAQDGSLRRQLLGFVVAELLTLGANIGVLRFARSALPPWAGESSFLALASTFLVFVGFSYPVWHLVFRNEETAESPDRYTGAQ